MMHQRVPDLTLIGVGHLNQRKTLHFLNNLRQRSGAGTGSASRRGASRASTSRTEPSRVWTDCVR